MAAYEAPPIPTLPQAQDSLTSLGGLRAAGVRAGIKASGLPDVALLVADEPIPVAAVFTQNLFAAAPVVVSREHLKASGGMVRAFVVNSGNANACTGARGLDDARAMCAQVAERLGCRPHEVLVCSTGVIGVNLPMERVRNGIDAAFRELDAAKEAGRRFHAAIMTTDAFAKEHSERVGDAVVAGVCKGAGMIQPDMATMLAFIGTNLALSPAELKAAIPTIASQSFNAVHVDTHPSTNDSFFLLATGRQRAAADGDWRDVVTRTARRLAWLIARDGEGASKVTTITVKGAASDEAAKAIAEKIATSALVRTALYGNDPNWGRFVSQVGNSKAVRSVRGLRCTLQGVVVFDDAPTAFDRPALVQAMAKTDDCQLVLELTEGQGHATLMTSDLGYRYIEINAEYTT